MYWAQASNLFEHFGQFRGDMNMFHSHIIQADADFLCFVVTKLNRKLRSKRGALDGRTLLKSIDLYRCVSRRYLSSTLRKIDC